ncbi:MAG: VTT domain-containing protein [Parvularculaceae bacterium]|nr:VTT domain-containing protein [Parvularculaceae bacterium]
MWALGSVCRFLTSMDAKTLTSIVVSVGLMLAVSILFLFGQTWIQFGDEGGLATWLAEFSQSPLAVPTVMAVFVLLALTGFPQWFLIAGTILAFGPRDGAFLSWLATMVSATVTFMLGRFTGGAWVRRFGGERTKSTIELIGRHGILASGLIRIIPSGPFIVVNAAAGAARLPFWKYLAGTSVGIIPKILIVAALSGVAPEQRNLAAGPTEIFHFLGSLSGADWVLFGAVAFGWLGLILFVRQFYVGLQGADTTSEAESSSALASGEESS